LITQGSVCRPVFMFDVEVYALSTSGSFVDGMKET